MFRTVRSRVILATVVGLLLWMFAFPVGVAALMGDVAENYWYSVGLASLVAGAVAALAGLMIGVIFWISRGEDY